MSTSEALDVTMVHTLQAREHRGLQVDLLTNHSAEDLVRGRFRESGFNGVVREGGKLTDLVSTFWAAVFLLSDRFKDALEQHRFSGYRTLPISITGYAGRTTLWLLTVSGACGRLYGVDGDPLPGGGGIGNFLDPTQWDGSDLFVADNHNAIFMTPRCADVLGTAGLSNLELRQEGLEPLIRP
jgi:hypothetical protein